MMLCYYCDGMIEWLKDVVNEDGTTTSYYICPKCGAEYEIIK